MNQALIKKIYVYQAELCKALAHPVRLEILDRLSHAELNNTQLMEFLQIPKANLSQHLNVLKSAGVVEVRHDGLFQYSKLSSPQVKEACSLIRKMLLEKLDREENHNTELKKLINKS